MIFSALGQKTDIRERKTVVISPKKVGCSFQIDKPLYQPGQKVRCRVVCLDSQLKAVNEKFSSIYLMDSSRVKIAQWDQIKPERGIHSVEFQLIPEAPPGSYSFRAERESGGTLSHWFTVEEYVPPRFSVNIDMPSTISVLDESMPYKVAANYVYGEPVAGKVVMSISEEPNLYGRSRNCLRQKEARVTDMTEELGPDGIHSGKYVLGKSFSAMSVRAVFTVIEEATGIQVKESRYTWVTNKPASLNFEYSSMKPHYKRGLDYIIEAKLTDEQNRPMANQEIEIELDGNQHGTATTDSEGKINYAIDTSNMVAPNFTAKVNYKNPDQCYHTTWGETDYPTADFTVFRYYSKSGSFMQAKSPKGELPIGQDHIVEMQYNINPSGVNAGVTKLPLFYLVMSNSKIVYSGQEEIDLTSSRNGSLSVKVPVSAEMSPNANLITYALLNDEVIAETVELNVELGFKNQVSMTFAQEKGTPGSDAEVLITGDPESFCGIRVIDSSLLLLNSYDPFTPSAVYNSIRTWSYGYNIAGFDVEDPAPPCEDPDKLVFFEGNYYLPQSSKMEQDSYQQLKNVGLRIGTGLVIRKPEVCDKNPPEQSKYPVTLEHASTPGVSGPLSFKASADSAGRGGGAGSVETFRTNFVETFMWNTLLLDGEGRARLTEKSPDSITKWQGSAFCFSDKNGFGMTKYAANYTAMQPFFAEMSMPHSVIRGELMVLTAMANNYLDNCAKVEISLEPSAAFTAELMEGTEEAACVCSKGKASRSWKVQAKQIGEMAFQASAQTSFIGPKCDGPSDDSQPSYKDTVVQSVKVEPEGVKQERTLTELIYVKKDTKSVLPIKINLPASAVPDSVSASVSAVGDIFGVHVRSLNDLVEKPYGCGEQNLGRMAAIPYVLDYLNNTGQLTKEVLEKAKGYMTEGYYRQLGFLTGRAYRMFPNYYEQPNSWLTVYTFSTFEKIKEHVYVDETLQQQTLMWLGNTQKLDNGCFQPQGQLYMRENVDDSLHFSAYVAISLLNSDYSMAMTLVDGAMKCLKDASTKDQKASDEALMLYAFTLADLPEYRDKMLNKIMKRAIVEGGTTHWEREDAPKERPVPFFLPIYAPADVKMTAYILLSMVALPTKSTEHMATIAQTSLWLVRQMNSNGGFGSTTDTVVAVKALAAVAKAMYTPDAAHKVVVRRDNAEVVNLDLSPKNRMLVQTQPLPEANGNYIAEIQGNGWCVMQTKVQYYIPVPKENSAFSLALSSASDKCIEGVTQTFNISVKVSYHGSQNASNMAIFQMRMLTGYDADYWSLRELKEQKIVSKFDMSKKGELLLYLNSVSDEPISFTIKALMSNRVLNVKASSAMVYDYYNSEENGYASYGHPCTKIRTD